MKNETLDLITRWTLFVAFIVMVVTNVHDLTETWSDAASGITTGLSLIAAGLVFSKVFWLGIDEDAQVGTTEDEPARDGQVPVA